MRQDERVAFAVGMMTIVVLTVLLVGFLLPIAILVWKVALS